MSKKKIIITSTLAIIVSGIILVCTAYYYHYIKNTSINVSSYEGDALIGGSFELTDYNGNTVSDKSFPDQLKLIFFGFANCPDICPTTLWKLSDLLKKLGPNAKYIVPIFISIDENEDPEILKSYLGGFDKRIVGLTGNKDELKQAAEVYKVYYKRVPQPDSAIGYTIDHSSTVYFMDQEDKYILHFGYNDTVGDMFKQIKNYLEIKI